MTGTDTFAYELGLAAAADQARAGDHVGALHTLDRLEEEGPEKWDLVARVHAQRGDLDAAEAAWRRVLAARPDDRDALEGLRRVAWIAAGGRRTNPLAVRAPLVAAVALVVAGGVLLIPVLAGTSAGPDAVPSALPTTASPVESVDRAEEELKQRQDQLRARLDALATGVAGPGVRATRRDRDVEVVFDNGLFAPDSTEPTAEGRDELAAFAARLSGWAVTVTVFGHGVVVPGSPATGGSGVAVARAATAAEALSSGSGLAMTSFLVRSADQSTVPHQGTDPSVQAKNRTVTLLIAPA